MRRKLAGLALGLAAVAMLALSGCGAMTPAEPAAGIEMDLGIQMDGRMRISCDPDTIYENMEGTAEMMGFQVPASMEDAWTRTLSHRRMAAVPSSAGICRRTGFPLTRK